MSEEEFLNLLFRLEILILMHCSDPILENNIKFMLQSFGKVVHHVYRFYLVTINVCEMYIIDWFDQCNC